MPTFKNTDNGNVLEVAEIEAFIYEDASNYERVDKVKHENLFDTREFPAGSTPEEKKEQKAPGIVVESDAPEKSAAPPRAESAPKVTTPAKKTATVTPTKTQAKKKA